MFGMFYETYKVYRRVLMFLVFLRVWSNIPEILIIGVGLFLCLCNPYHTIRLLRGAYALWCHPQPSIIKWKGRLWRLVARLDRSKAVMETVS
jgi:hypothetical protein